jgi:hypothetical protein
MSGCGFSRRTWWLKTSTSIGDRREFPVVEPTIDTAGQVRANRGWIGAARRSDSA